MHGNTIVLVGLVFASGCAASAGGSRGVTYREHVGSTLVVFTNATPEKMCELRMSFEDQKQMGDNWLPENGLPSGKSAEFKVRPGRYQATWSTCKDGDKPYYAGTLIADTAIGVDQQTQLYAYTADTVSPTKRAPVLTRDYKIVKFSGQPVGPIDKTPPVKVDAFAAAEAQLAGKGSAAPARTATTAEAPPEKFSAKGMIDPKAKHTVKKGAVKPSLARKRDFASANASYRSK